MPAFDRDQQRVVVRVVYDGPASAGKTTNLAQLCRFFSHTRRSELVAPEERAGRTLFFDWLEVDGGLVGGYRLRCQLVTVPGQGVLSHRRRYLLRTADALVFVCESTLSGAEIGRRMIQGLQPQLPDGPPPLVVQANKQDLPHHIEAERMLEALGVPPGTHVVPAQANEGTGVRETVVLAIRAAANRAQQRMLSEGISSLPAARETSVSLHAALLAAEAGQPQSDSSTSLALSSLGEAPASPIAAPPATSAPDAGSESGLRTDPPVPTTGLPSGYVWPASHARQMLRAFQDERAVRRADLVGRHGTADGSGTSDVVILQAGSLCLKTSLRRRFPDAEMGRTSMVELARKKAQLGELLPPRTALYLQPAVDGAAWLWTMTPWLTTLRGAMEAASAASDEEGLAGALRSYAVAAAKALALTARAHLVLDVHPSNFALSDSRVVYLDDDIVSGDRIPGIGHALLRRVEEYERHSSAVEAYLHALEAALGEALTRDDAARLRLRQTIGDARVRSAAARQAQDRLLDSVGAP
jgi:signal recognition particle receptor subunit beta